MLLCEFVGCWQNSQLLIPEIKQGHNNPVITGFYIIIKHPQSCVGHNGDSAEIPLFSSSASSTSSSSSTSDPKTQLRILERMVAHTQYTFPGDRTLEAMDHAMTHAGDGDLILVISDANLQRYRIDPDDVGTLLLSSSRRSTNVHAHLVLIGSFGDEANQLARAIPNERAQVCMDTAELPRILTTIVASAAAN